MLKVVIKYGKRLKREGAGCQNNPTEKGDAEDLAVYGVQIFGRRMRIGEPKSILGYRTIPLTDGVIDILKRQKEKNGASADKGLSEKP